MTNTTGNSNSEATAPILSLEAQGIDVCQYNNTIEIPFVPVPRRLDLTFLVKAVACGSHHSLLLSEDG